MNIRGLFSLAAAALIVAATSARADNIVWTNTAGGNWSDTNSWNPNQMPGSGDVAVITNDGTYSVTLDVNPAIGGLVLGTTGGANIQSLSVSNNQTFTLNGTAQVSANGQFNLNGGVLGGNIVLVGALNCSAGTLSGGLTVSSNSVLTVSAPGVTLNSFTPGSSALTNYGTANWTGGDLDCNNSPQIYNYGLWNAETDNSIFGQQTSGNVVFNNYGTFRKSGGSNTTTIDTNAVFNGSGTVDVESGTVSIANGQYAGVVNTAGGAFLSPGSSLIFGGSTLFTGTGSVEGSVIGSNALFSGTMTCSGTTLSGTITIVTNSVLDLGTSNVNLSGVALTNYGTANWTGGDLDCNNSPQIYNYGLWNAETDNTFVGEINTGNGNGVFNNYGIFRKSGGSNTTTIDTNAVFNGSGTVDVESGTVLIANGQYAGVVNAAGGAFLSLGSSLIFDGSTLFTGTGSVEGSVIGSNAVFSGTMTCSGVTISGAITVATNAVVNLGTLGVSFNNGYNNTALLTNYGTINWSSGNVAGDNNPIIYNYGLWNDQSDNTLFGQQTSGNTTFNNIGTFRKSGGSGITTLDNNTVFNNTGTMDVQSGTVSILGSRTLTGGTLNFGINSLNTFGRITLAGAVTLTGNVSVNLNSLYSPTNGSSFALLTYGSESGVFTGSNLPAFFGWTNIYGPASFSLKIVSAPMRVLNVTNFGAVGDAVQFFASTTSNSVVVTTTNQIPNTAIGEAIEVFGAGIPTSSIYNQDLITTITNVVNGTNIYVSQACQQTLTNTFATYGHNNTANFQAAIAAVGKDTNDTIYIPAGTYLFLTTSQYGIYGQYCILIQRGGINFVGAGTNSTTLLSQGAWTLIGGAAWRGFLVEVASPATNNFPLTFANLTMDGGVQQGNTSYHFFPASLLTGHGWDETHSAFLTWCVSSASLSYYYFTNVLVQHWRGEEFKSIDQPANSTIGIYNSTFADGNATALNVYPSWDVRSNSFVNLFQVAEYYQQFYSFPAYFEYNFVTNITGNGFAVNGGRGNNPPLTIGGNVFYINANGANSIELLPGDNVSIINNQIFNLGSGDTSINLSAEGYQGTFCISNILISGNYVTGNGSFISFGSAPPDNTVSVTVCSNTLAVTSGNGVACHSYGLANNVHFYANNFPTNNPESWISGTASDGVTRTGQFALVESNNIYEPYLYSPYAPSISSGTTNVVSYGNGPLRITSKIPSGVTFVLEDTNAWQIPTNAYINFNNAGNINSYPVYYSQSMTTGFKTVPAGGQATFYWQPWANAWSSNTVPPPPTNVRLNF